MAEKEDSVWRLSAEISRASGSPLFSAGTISTVAADLTELVADELDKLIRGFYRGSAIPWIPFGGAA
jgi:hypothetical protein